MKENVLKIILIFSAVLFIEIMCRLYYEFTGNTNLFRLSSVKEAIYEFKPNSEEKRWGTIVKINSLGFRGHEYSPHKSKGITRILVLGDSITMGFKVPVEYVFAKRIEDLLSKKYEVWNLGVGGYDSWKEAAMLREKWIAYNPDIVILAICLNDYDNSQNLYWVDWLGKFKSRNNSRAKYFNWLYFHSDLYRLIYDNAYTIKNNFKISDFSSQLKLSDEQIERWEVPLKDIVDTCRQRNIKIIFSVFPLRRQAGKYEMSEPSIDSFCKKYEVPFLDMISYLKEEHFCDELHLNEAGHQITTEAIVKFLTEKGVLKSGL